MDDLEITRRCARAMGLPVATKRSWERFEKNADRCWIHADKCRDGSVYEYDPLHDDAQAMALLKRFALSVRMITDATWEAEDPVELWRSHSSDSVNRAICLCVARLAGEG